MRCLFTFGIFALLKATIVQAGTTYYVSPSGNDANPGTSRNLAWRNPDRCVKPPTPLIAGDTCLVLSGTYSEPDGDGKGPVVLVRTTSPKGTAQAPITIKSEIPHGAVILVPPDNGTGFYFSSGPYYVVEGFEIRGVQNNTNSSHHGFSIYSGAKGLTIRNNVIHDIGNNVCSPPDQLFAQAAIVGSTDDLLIEKNRIYTIGQLRPGENGCTPGHDNKDHGIYTSKGTNLTIRNNVFFDVNRGYAIVFYAIGGATTTNVFIYNNVFADRTPTNWPDSQIRLTQTLRNVQIRNNIFYNPRTYAIGWLGAVVENMSITHNLTNGTNGLVSSDGRPTSGLTDRDNIVATDPVFVNPLARDYRLKAGSPAIDRGMDVGLAFIGSKPDIGAFEFSGPVVDLTPSSPRQLTVR